MNTRRKSLCDIDQSEAVDSDPPSEPLPARSRLRLVASRKMSAMVDHLRFMVGQDNAGHWLAVELRGRAGGIFTCKEAALHYARHETGHRPGGVRLTPRALAFPI